MRTQETSSPADLYGIGIAFASAGVYFVLVGWGVLPMPGNTASPPFIIVCAGLAFLFAGLVAVVRGKAGANDRDSELPPDAPRWTQAAYRVLGIGVAGALATIGTWIAIGSGPRAFDVSGPFVEMHTTGELIGRSVFGLGAVIVWIYVIAITVGTVRKFFGPSPVIPGRAEGADPESRRVH
jgi:hypothetical protein